MQTSFRNNWKEREKWTREKNEKKCSWKHCNRKNEFALQSQLHSVSKWIALDDGRKRVAHIRIWMTKSFARHEECKKFIYAFSGSQHRQFHSSFAAVKRFSRCRRCLCCCYDYSCCSCSCFVDRLKFMMLCGARLSNACCFCHAPMRWHFPLWQHRKPFNRQQKLQFIFKFFPP